MAANTPARSFRTPLGQVRGLGSAKHGAGHWLNYRLLSAAYVPLVIWFVISAVGLVGADHPSVLAFIAQPVNAILLILLIGVTFHHAAYGMQEIYEDYISPKLLKTAAIGLTRGLCLVLAVACLFAVVRIAVLAPATMPPAQAAAAVDRMME